MATRTILIPLTSGHSLHGDPVIGSGNGMPGDAEAPAGFSVNLVATGGAAHFKLSTESIEPGENELDAAVCWEWIVPHDYVAGEDGTLVVNAGAFGDPYLEDCTIDAEVHRMSHSDAGLGDIVTTAAQALEFAQCSYPPWPFYSFNLDGTGLAAGERLLIIVRVHIKSDTDWTWANIGEAKLTLECEDTMSAEDLANLNVDTTGGTLSLAKALEVIVARCVGNIAYDSQSGVVTFYGRDGQTTVATVKLTGGGARQDSNIP